MCRRRSCVAVLALLLASALTGRPQDTAAAPAGAAIPAAAAAASLRSELDGLIERINAKIRAGRSDATALAEELAEFDALITRHSGENEEAIAQAMFAQAMLQVRILEDFAAGEAILARIAAEYPRTEVAAALPRLLAQIEEETAAARAMAALLGQAAPPLHFEWATRHGLTALADLKGKVVVLDFWATWCGPCISSFPQMRELVAHYEGRNVEVIGVTSLQGAVHGLSAQPIDCRNDAAKEYALMAEFIEKKNVTWTVAFSREPVFNPAWGVRGIPYLAIVAPDGTVRHAGLHPSLPLAHKTEKIDALLAEFAEAPSAQP